MESATATNWFTAPPGMAESQIFAFDLVEVVAFAHSLAGRDDQLVGASGTKDLRSGASSSMG